MTNEEIRERLAFIEHAIVALERGEDRLARLERAVVALERKANPMLQRSESGPIDLDQLARRVDALEAELVPWRAKP